MEGLNTTNEPGAGIVGLGGSNPLLLPFIHLTPQALKTTYEPIPHMAISMVADRSSRVSLPSGGVRVG